MTSIVLERLNYALPIQYLKLFVGTQDGPPGMAAKTEDLRLIPGNHTKEEENPLCHTCTMAQKSQHTYTLT